MIWVEERGRGELAPFVFIFPNHLPFFGFFPHNFLIRAKMRKSRKETKGRIHDPILTHPVYGHWGGGPNGGRLGWRFFFRVDGRWRQEEIEKMVIMIISLFRGTSEEHQNSLQRLPTVDPRHSSNWNCNWKNDFFFFFFFLLSFRKKKKRKIEEMVPSERGQCLK